MPVINGNYYMNPQYGHALEDARSADAAGRESDEDSEPSWLDVFLGYSEGDPTDVQASQTQQATDQTASQSRSDRAAMSYSEKADGSVAEHEAIQSTVMNRVASGDKQYVRSRRPVNEYNVIHAPHQYQGVPSIQNLQRNGKSQFARYKSGAADSPGARNAAIADENLRRTGKPANDATFFIVNPGGKPPTDEQVHRLGNVAPAGRVGDVYLYKPPPASKR